VTFLSAAGSWEWLFFILTSVSVTLFNWPFQLLCSKALLRKLIVAQLVKKFPTFYEIQRFITALIKQYLSTKMAVFWVVAPCSLVQVYRRFRGACCRLTHSPEDGGSKNLWNVGKLLPDYTAQHPRRQSFLISFPEGLQKDTDSERKLVVLFISLLRGSGEPWGSETVTSLGYTVSVK
jgi:hypothetical protein